jgi:glycine cleavage system aminomethyltransferase T
MRLWSQEETPKEVGWISSAARSERAAHQIALGYVKRGYNEEHSQLLARLEPEAEPTRVTIVPLPFI